MATLTRVDDDGEIDMESPITYISVIDSVLDQVTIFQEGLGVPKENYTYMTLMTAMLTMAGRAVHAVFSLMLALAPVTEIALHVARFILEKCSEMIRTEDRHELLIKITVFAVQLSSALFLVMFVFGTILFPVFYMGMSVLSRLLFMVTGRNILD